MNWRDLPVSWIFAARRLARYLPGTLAGFAVAGGVAWAEPPKGYPFVRYQEGIEQAKASKRPAFILFGFKGCPHCKLLEREIFDIPRQKELFEKYYTLIYVDIRGRGELDAPYVTPDGEKLTREQIERQYRARGAPSWVFLNREQSPVLFGNGSGQKPSSFLMYHKYVLEENYLKQSFKQFLRELAIDIETDSPGNTSR